MDEELKERLRVAYNLNAAARDVRELAEWRRVARDAFAALLRQEGKRALLELGSGPGNDGLYFREQGLDVLCTDLSPEHIRFCQEKGLAAQVMDFTEMSLPPNSFDAVYAMNSLLHLPKLDLPGVLANIKVVLKPDGLFFMGVYGGIDTEGIFEDDAYEPKRFFAMYMNDDLKRILSGFFEIVSFTAVPNVGDDPDMVWQAVVMRN